MTTDYGDLVGYIVRSLVDHPDEVQVSQTGRSRAHTVEVRLNPEDVGRVIGKSGKNIEAVRALVKAAAVRDHARVNVEVVTEDDEREAPVAVAVGAPSAEADAGEAAEDDAEGTEEEDAEGTEEE
jgi:predicted RNA-binding protein YlqC (UPF0109 family)